MKEQEETFADKLLGFTIPSRNVRARLVRIDAVLDEVLSAHDYPAPVTHLLSEALVLCALMGGLLKDENSQLTMQAQTRDGPISLLVADYRDGDLRGYAQFDRGRLEGLGANPSLASLFGEGFLAVTFETGKKRRYQGIVPLEGESLSDSCETYFSQSEQLPTMIRVASSASGERRVAAGLLIQHLADGEEGRERLHVRMDHPDWEHVATLSSTISHEELLSSSLSLEAIAWRLFHEEEEVRIQAGPTLARGCRCSAEYYEGVIRQFDEDERDDMRNEDGRIVVDCAFCSRKFELAA